MIFSTSKPDFASAWAVLRVDTTLDRQVAEILPETPPVWSPEYLRKSWDQRRQPSVTFPWAKSLIIMAIPFRNLPAVALPAIADGSEFAGKVSGYASRVDYHRAAPQMLSSLHYGNRCEIVVDTKPLAEKTLATIAGIGSIGLNNCLLLPGSDSGCFIASILTDAELPELRLPRVDYCTKCRQCLDNCPNQHCNPTECISALTMERRGGLTTEERHLIGDWIFGCSKCTAACPGTQLPTDFNLDLEWLLMTPSGEVARCIRDTPLNYAGIQLLRRNALYVLARRDTPRCRNLIEQFSKTTGSQFLKQLSADLYYSS